MVYPVDSGLGSSNPDVEGSIPSWTTYGRLVKWYHAWFTSNRQKFDSSNAYCIFWLVRLLARTTVFQAVEDGSKPSRVT